MTEGRLNDPIEWSAPLSLQLPRISICGSRTSLTIVAKPVYLKSDRTGPMTPVLGHMTIGNWREKRAVSVKQLRLFCVDTTSLGGPSESATSYQRFRICELSRALSALSRWFEIFFNTDYDMLIHVKRTYRKYI